MQNVLAAETAELFQLQTFRLLFFIFGAVVGNAIATGALKMNGLAHVVPDSLLRSPATSALGEQPGSQKMLRNVTSPRAVLNR